MRRSHQNPAGRRHSIAAKYASELNSDYGGRAILERARCSRTASVISSYAPAWISPGRPFRGVGIGREIGVALGSDLTGHRDPKHTVHYTRVAGIRFEGLWR